MMLKLYSRLIACLVVASSLASASFINGGFETGDLSGWSLLGEVTGSTTYDYPGVGSVLPDTGNYAARLISEDVDASAIAAQMSIDVDTLQASNDGLEATIGSLIWQSTFATAGDVLQFRWNFVENDYLPYDDWAFYGIQYESNATEVTKFASLASVGPDGGSTINGWSTLTVTIAQTGNYTFYFGVVNGFDSISSSELWLDGAYAGDAPPEPPGGGSEVPEPATFALLVPALAALVIRSRRASKA